MVKMYRKTSARRLRSTSTAWACCCCARPCTRAPWWPGRSPPPPSARPRYRPPWVRTHRRHTRQHCAELYYADLKPFLVRFIAILRRFMCSDSLRCVLSVCQYEVYVCRRQSRGGGRLAGRSSGGVAVRGRRPAHARAERGAGAGAAARPRRREGAALHHTPPGRHHQ